MKIKDGFTLRCVAGKHIAVPVGERSRELHGMICLNESGAFLFEKAQVQTDACKLCDALCDEYDVSRDEAMQSVVEFLDYLRSEGILEDE
ncbi:MAG: PqqD family protein [Oscillospiraceae bacterium]|nr:PqqD family protein [Oscillospiraceae bacterium]